MSVAGYSGLLIGHTARPSSPLRRDEVTGLTHRSRTRVSSTVVR